MGGYEVEVRLLAHKGRLEGLELADDQILENVHGGYLKEGGAAEVDDDDARAGLIRCSGSSD